MSVCLEPRPVERTRDGRTVHVRLDIEAWPITERCGRCGPCRAAAWWRAFGENIVANPVAVVGLAALLIALVANALFLVVTG